MRDHTKLRAFQLADTLAIQVYEVTRGFPRDEMFGLTSQLRRAAVSAASNIVEGCARHSESEYVHFLNMAYGSVCEIEYQLSLAERLGYFSKANDFSCRERCNETARVLAGLIRSYRRQPQ